MKMCIEELVRIAKDQCDSVVRVLERHAKETKNLELIEQVGDMWKIERIETASDEGDLLFINYRRDENV